MVGRWSNANQGGLYMYTDLKVRRMSVMSDVSQGGRWVESTLECDPKKVSEEARTDVGAAPD
jgi:hypothetical protein